MYQAILILHVFIAVGLVLLVLVQQGKGASMGSAFGSGASQTMFGSRGSGSFLLKITVGLGFLFFATSIALNYIATSLVKQPTAFILPVNGSKEALPVSPSSIPLTAPSTQQQPVTPAN
jgi:preprotein translocase subunit SecG